MYIQIYQDKKEEWRWRFRADNNETMADSGEGYKNKQDMYGALEAVCGGWTTLFTYHDEAGEKVSIPVLNRHDGTTISIRET